MSDQEPSRLANTLPGGKIYLSNPIKDGDNESSEDRVSGFYYDLSEDEALGRILSDVQEMLKIQRGQAELTLQFHTLRPLLDRSRRNHNGALMRMLTDNSGAYNLVELLRDGFRFNMDN